MTYYAVIDTNVFISALLTKQPDSATVQVLDVVIDGKLILRCNLLASSIDLLTKRSFSNK